MAKKLARILCILLESGPQREVVEDPCYRSIRYDGVDEYRGMRGIYYTFTCKKY